MIYDASLEIIPAPGTDPVHVFLTKNGKWEGCYCNTSKVLLKSDERFRLLFYFKGIIIRGFSSPVLLKLSGDGVSGCFLFVLHFSVHFTFPILSLSLVVGVSD